MALDPRIDAKIAEAAPFARPILTHLRAVVHAALPDVEETIKWGMPHFMLGGKNLAGMAAFKAHCAFMIHGDGRQGDAMGQFGKIRALGDLPAAADLAVRLLEARARIETKGTALKKTSAAARAPQPELLVPPELAAALAANPQAKSAFTAFAPSHRREYLEWIAEAKRPETRAKRIAQTAEWLTEGKKRNWKYEGC